MTRRQKVRYKYICTTQHLASTLVFAICWKSKQILQILFKMLSKIRKNFIRPKIFLIKYFQESIKILFQILINILPLQDQPII